ncbi:HlyD family efflux transporter periplasmic adaptor subunit [Candidatus Poribacteria bacterium]|nr:HlyD family efflux transporter periplasmic adaptor subunit [Candidatus Poribacteria bacterium]
MMGRWKVITIAAAVVLVVAVAVVVGRIVFATKDDAGNGEAQDIKTAMVERGDIAVTIDATGTIKPLNIVKVGSKASGKILELKVDAGDYVQKDDIIAVIETTYVQISLEQAQADLQSAQARLQQAEIDIQLQREQSEIQIRQAQESLAEAQQRLIQLKEDIRLEKIANQRGVMDAENSLNIAKIRYKLLTSDEVRDENKQRAQATLEQDKANLDLVTAEHERNKTLYEKELISQAALESSQAQLKSAQARYRSSEENVKLVEQPATEAELELGKADIKKAEFNLALAKERVEGEAARDMDIELQQQRIVQAEESLKLAQANRKQITRKERDIETARLAVKRNETQLELRRIEYDDTVIKAPISGTILEKMVEEGQVITSRLSSIASEEGQTLVTMADLDTVYVVTEVDETDIGKVQIGQPVTITVEAYPDMPFQGEVLKIAPQGQVIQNVTTFEVTSELKNVAATGTGQGMMRGAEERRGGNRQAGEGRPDFANMTDEQRERFRAMRQQRQAEGGDADGIPSRPTPQEPPARQPEQQEDSDVAEAKAETDADDWGGLFGGFFEDIPPEEPQTQTQPTETETSRMPFLKPGMNASVQISAVNKTGILTLPTEAVLDMRGRKMVRIVGPDGQPGRPQPVVTGVSSFDKIEIISGLTEGDSVALGGFQPGGGGGEDWRRRMMQNPASTMRRMTGGGRGR